MSWIADARHGFRVLAKTPAVTATAALTLAVAIGINTALFSIVDAAMLRPFPYADPERIVWIDHTIPIQTSEGIPVSYPTVVDWSRRARSHARMAAFRYASFVVTGDGDSQRVSGLHAGAGLFELLGVAPALGRGFAANDDRPGATEVAVISHGLWQRRFGKALSEVRQEGLE